MSLCAPYLPPHLDQRRVAMKPAEMVGAGVIIGDLNYCSSSKKRRLKAFIREPDIEVIGTTQHIHKWGEHRCRIDRVLTRARAGP